MPEAAQLALEQMNSVMLGGRNIKVRHPGWLELRPATQTASPTSCAEGGGPHSCHVAHQCWPALGAHVCPPQPCSSPFHRIVLLGLC